MRSYRGFSLPELLIVIAIIAILAVILILNLMHIRDNATAAACESNERRIAEAVDSYAVDHGGRVPQGQGFVTADLFGGPNNPYMNQPNLVDPANGQPYLYTEGPGMCQNPDAIYQIVDQGGHSSASLLALLAGDSQEDSIAFCSDRGLYAFQNADAPGASMDQPRH
jgi:prepilin-type N-terminal cleavage/methylation domain-containing protein